MSDTSMVSARAGMPKREAILSATLRLIARSGLHNTPMSAIAREAGVAAGTLYLYFESKEALINALYLGLVSDRDQAALKGVDPGLPPRERLWRSWSRFARWHLEHRDASNFIQQCEASGILAPETRARHLEMRAAGVESFAANVRKRVLRDVPVEVFYALFAGPIYVLAHMRDKQEIEITDEILRLTFEGVSRSIMRSPS